MKELNKNEFYSLKGLSDEQLKVLSEKTDIDLDCLKLALYIRFNDFWKYGTAFNKYVKEEDITAEALDLFEEEKQDLLFGITSDKVVQSVMNDLNERSKIGVGKYGVTLERTDLSLKDWLQHQYEEVLDQANYLKRAIIELEK